MILEVEIFHLFFKYLHHQSRLYETLSESLSNKSTILMFISNNKSEITIGTYDEVNIRMINSKVASSQPYAQSLSPCRDKRDLWLKHRVSGHFIKDTRS
jgi:hypothetical protein